MSSAVGAFLTFSSLAGREVAWVRVTVGLPSTVSTPVGWYCSAQVSQGGSCCSRSIAIGA